MGLLDKIFGSKNQKVLKKIQPLVNSINSLEEELSKLTNEALKKKRENFIDRHRNGESLDDLLPEAFAVVREVSTRQLGLRHYDCQLIGGIALHNCQIAEMATGEGKTLVATLPSYLNSITERKVVLVTVNDYLAKRDAEWMGPIYENLGMSVSFIIPGQQLEERKAAYEADVIYATNNELGFDFLRNNMVVNKNDRMMNDYYFAIIDEVDSILIDEARTPLVISGPAENTAQIYQKISKFIPKLEEQTIMEVDDENDQDQNKGDAGHFVIDEKSKQVELTDFGHDFIEQLLKDDNLLEEDQSLYSSGNLRLLHYIQSSLRAHFLFNKDVDYMVQNNQVVLIDENTGRAMPGRRLADGLHQAIEQKENVPIQMESQTLASCTFQNYFRQYEKLSGMTGTASTEAEEFAEIYGLNVLEVPTNEPMIRDDKNDLVYLTQAEKYKAVINEIKDYKNKGNPILVGTASLESSELLSSLLKKENIEHQVLNAKNHAKEAEIISQAGKPGVITIATNMAGRGTDIVLGGNWEAELEKHKDDSKKEELESKWKILNSEVINSGGLHVIGTERNESRRMDNQLRGRSGRQGDPGSSRFYISLEDNLMRIFASDQFKNIMQRVGLEEGESIEHRMLSGAIERAQKRVEGRNFDIRKMLLEYDDMANEQRQIIYSQRNNILEADVITELLDSMRETIISDELDSVSLGDLEPHEWNTDMLESSLSNIFGQEIPVKEWIASESNMTREDVEQKILMSANHAYIEKCSNIGPVMRDFEKQILLQIIDNAWKDHLAEVDALRQGIGLRSYASKNPKLEFRRESFELFENLLNKIRLEGIRFLSRVEIELEDSGDLNLPKQNQAQNLDHPSPESALTPARQEASTKEQGNRRLRRAEAKMARKNARKK
ncbi:preprotein translocase subunit SecA [SAR86 cluster bacterium]|nr:preprotein translocase subunit SecA [SAR86 cluster bacterium]